MLVRSKRCTPSAIVAILPTTVLLRGGAEDCTAVAGCVLQHTSRLQQHAEQGG
jgi:hypothetical protein